MSTATARRGFTISQASKRGWGHPQTIRRRILDGRLRAEVIDDRGTYWIAEEDLEASDLGRFREPAAGAKYIDPEIAGEQAPPAAVSLDELAIIAARVVSTWPRLSDERKAELGRLLAA
ncbi:hypothetical protein K8F61_09360 [Microbacterium resistens]|uniref:DNA-binding protein n=1 Tax=Microbacterium resistens TaxID=156977 RepID=A0ABY3RZ58_9MICO|nr:hypothetical protein [Microbacterium resistens]UGS28339.1 hypothetical protein K8F61_09360 [Microbacterium resistens]